MKKILGLDWELTVLVGHLSMLMKRKLKEWESE
jgi:hypothetical protein